MRLHTLTLHTAHFSSLVSFYRDTLGLPLSSAETGEARFQIGRSGLIFKEDTAFRGFYHFAFSIPCNQAREAKTWLENRGLALLRDPKGSTLVDFPNWNAEAVYFIDPAGNIVECIARRDLRNESAEPFGPASLLDISEIGIVTSDVLAWSARAASEYGVFPFDKSVPGPDFSALGTDAGLFIVVPERRTWFMTELPATPAPLTVHFKNEAGDAFVYAG